MEKVSVKTKLIILIVLICGFVLLINNYSDAAYVKVTGIRMTHTQRNLFLNGSKYVQLQAVISPSNATNQSVRWKSSNENVATVDKNRKSNR